MSPSSWALSRARLRNIAGSEFLRQIAGTFGTRLALVATGLVASVLVARSLGPEGRGAIAIAGALTAIATQFGNLGLHASNTWAVSRQPRLLGPLIANSVVLSVLVGGLEITVIVGLALVRPDMLPITGPLLALSVTAIPLGLLTLFSQNLLLGLQRVRDYNVLDLTTRVLSIIATGGLITAGLVSAEWFLAAGTIVTLVVVLATVIRLWRLSEVRPAPRFSLIREYGRFGLNAYAAALISFLVIRVDLFLVQAFRGFEAVGEYSIAVAMADLVYALPVVVGTLLFPRLSRMESPIEQVRFARSVAGRVALVMSGAAVAAAVLANPAVRLLYGDAFAPAIPAFIWLMPGIVALSVHTICMNYVASVGFPSIAILAAGAGLVINLLLNVALLPRLGIIGASIASSAAYGAMLTVSGGYVVSRLRSLSATLTA